MRAEEVTDRSIDPDVFFNRESPVSAARYCHQLVRDAGGVQGLVKPRAVVVGNDRVGVTVDTDDRREVASDVRHRRHALRDRITV